MSEEQSIAHVRLVRLLGRFWTLPNMLSLIRLMLIIPITYLILIDGPILWLLSLIGLAVLSDWLDGSVARWFKSESSWGKVLDPLADKVGAAIILTALTVRDVEPNLPLWFLVFIVMRDLCIVLGGVLLARQTGHVAMSTWLGKVAATFLALTLLGGVFRADQPVLDALVWTTAALMIVSFLIYSVRFFRLIRYRNEQELHDDPRLERLDAPDEKRDHVVADEATSLT